MPSQAAGFAREVGCTAARSGARDRGAMAGTQRRVKGFSRTNDGSGHFSFTPSCFPLYLVPASEVPHLVTHRDKGVCFGRYRSILMEGISRRAFTRDLLASLLVSSVVTSLSKAGVLAAAISRVVRPWVLEIEDLTK